MLNYHIGLALAALDRNDEAADAFREALAIDPNFLRADDARRRIEAAARPVTAAPSAS
jgi:tetratricopeptide (TPR) repeat protein